MPNEPDKHLKPGSLAGDAGEKPADGGHDKPATGGDELASGREGHEPVDDPFKE